MTTLRAILFVLAWTPSFRVLASIVRDIRNAPAEDNLD